MPNQGERDRSQFGDRLKIRDRIVGHSLEHALIGRMRRVGGDEDGVAVGSGSHHVLCSRDAAAAADVLNDHRLAERLRNVVSKQPGERIGRASGDEWHDKLDAAAWVAILRHGAAECGRDGSAQRNHLYQDFFHDLPPPCFAIRNGISSSRNDSDLPCPSSPRLELTPPSRTSSKTKLNAESFGRS